MRSYKTIQYLFVTVIFAVTLISCRDSLGIDPNPKKDYIDKPPFIDKSFPADSIYLSISELYNIVDKFNWNDNYTIQKQVVRIDTSEAIPRIWLDLDLASKKSDPGFPPRKDWVTIFKVRADSLPAVGNIFLIEPSYTGRWAFMNVYSAESNSTFTFTERAFDTKIKFYSFDTNLREIQGAVESVIFDITRLQTNSILVVFKIYY